MFSASVNGLTVTEKQKGGKEKFLLQLITGHAVGLIKLWGSNSSYLHFWKMGKTKVQEIASCFALGTTAMITLLLDEIPLEEKASS